MAKNKLQRFEEIKHLENVFEFEKNNKGKWSNFFQNKNPIILELACGKGEYAIDLAKMYPQKNFIGIDIKGNRLWVGAKKALEHKLTNVLFLRILIDRIDEYFDTNEISEIWITFPDPFLKKSKLKKRLTHPKFLRLYQKISNHKVSVHLKTDSLDLINFTKKVIQLYELEEQKFIKIFPNDKNLEPELQIQTQYEKLNISKSKYNFYIKFQLNEQLIETNKDKLLIELLK